MVIRNIYSTIIFVAIALATYFISCATSFFSIRSSLLYDKGRDSTTEKKQQQTHILELEEVLLKSIYHHTPNRGPLTNSFQRLEVTPAMSQASTARSLPLAVKQVFGTAYRPSNMAELFALGRLGSGKLTRWNYMQQEEQRTLHPIKYILPDVTDHETILALGLMTYNAYYEVEKEANWYDMGDEWKTNSTFGWDTDGLRGHVFGNKDNTLLIISLKGTTAAIFNGEPTGEKDKLNDNILFSCCCGKVGKGWTAVCDCVDDTNSYTCDKQCLDKSLLDSELYYDYTARIFIDVSDRYPNATIWLTGHSLGGAVASLVGQTYGAPAVTFESPGDLLAAQRLHLPHAPGAKDLPIWHFGNTADPIFIGVCTGVTSGCYYAGFAMETGCHTGKTCAWDTVKDNGWRVNIGNHRIGTVIESILKKPEEFPVPPCKVIEECVDCGLWTFKDDRDLPGGGPSF